MLVDINDKINNVLSNFSIRFSWSLSLLCGSLFLIFVALAAWQWQRAEEKILIQSTMDRVIQQPRLVVQRFADIYAERFMALSLEGEYLVSQSFLLDNVVKKGKAGYLVMTPFRLEQSKEIVLVNRGWIAALRTRDQLPVITTPSEIHSVSGWLERPRSKPSFQLDMENPEMYQQGVWQYLDIEYLASKLSASPVSWVVNLDEGEPNGFLRETPAFDAKIGMHYGYFIHWLVFAVFSVAAYLSLIIKRKRE